MPAKAQLKEELEQLVLEQIKMFKELKTMSDPDIFEFLLRSYRIRAFLEAKDQQVRQRFRSDFRRILPDLLANPRDTN